MKFRFTSLVHILAITVLLTLMVGAQPAVAAPKLPNYSPEDAGPTIRQEEATPELIQNTLDEAQAEAEMGIASSTPLSQCTLDSKYWLIRTLTGYGLATFDLVAQGNTAQIWVQRNLAFPSGDPRPLPVVTCEQAAYVLDEFEFNIYPTEISFFGQPNAMDGSYAYLPGLVGLPADYYYDAAGRQVVLVSNIRDPNYFDPTYPTYIAGFYSPTFEVYFDRNVMSIDAYDWANRTGPTAARPYLYEGIFAHEYQHLLHDDYDSDEELFVNEGMADLATYLTGYGHSTSHTNFLATHPENSLVMWEDQGPLEILADYGSAYLFQFYLMEQYGQAFIQAEFHDPGNGISGINSALAYFNSNRDFAAVFHDWSVALLIDSVKAGGRYMFQDMEFKLDIGKPAMPNPEAYNTPGVPPWGSDHIWVTGNPKKLARLTFNGIPYSMFPTDWSSDGAVLWGGTGDLVDNFAIFPAVGGGTLSFDTKYDIEEYWDFGFVQVSTDGGATWTSLANAYTISDFDPNAHPTVIANLPGLTGHSDWVNMSFDLSAYAGQDIMIAFRYVTDWATTEAGWYIDNVMVDGTLISDGSSTAPFKSLSELFPVNNDYTVTFVGFKINGRGNEYKVITMKLDEMTEQGTFELNKMLKTATDVAMLVTFDAPEGFNRYIDYSYEFGYTNTGPKK